MTDIANYECGKEDAVMKSLLSSIIIPNNG